MEDKELVSQILRSGDTRPFAQLMQRYSGMVFSKAMGVVHSDELAAEVTQQTFIRAYDRLDTWRGERFGPWLLTIAMHVALNLLDKERRRRTSSLDDLHETDSPLLDGYSPEREQQLQRMEQAIAQLPDTDRQLLELHYYQQQKTDAIARHMGLTQSNVLVRLHRIRERLKSLMQHERNES